MGIFQLIKIISEYFTLFRIITTILGIVGCYKILHRNSIYSVVKGPRFMLLADQVKSHSLGVAFMLIWSFQIILLICNCIEFKDSFAQVASMCYIAMFILERVIAYRLVVFYKLDKLWLLLLFTLLPIGLFAISCYPLTVKQSDKPKQDYTSGSDDSLNSSYL